VRISETEARWRDLCANQGDPKNAVYLAWIASRQYGGEYRFLLLHGEDLSRYEWISYDQLTAVKRVASAGMGDLVQALVVVLDHCRDVRCYAATICCALAKLRDEGYSAASIAAAIAARAKTCDLKPGMSLSEWLAPMCGSPTPAQPPDYKARAAGEAE